MVQTRIGLAVSAPERALWDSAASTRHMAALSREPRRHESRQEEEMDYTLLSRIAALEAELTEAQEQLRLCIIDQANTEVELAEARGKLCEKCGCSLFHRSAETGWDYPAGWYCPECEAIKARTELAEAKSCYRTFSEGLVRAEKENERLRELLQQFQCAQTVGAPYGGERGKV